MPYNALVTGPPRSGKTTALERTIDRLRELDLRVRGLAAPEIREDGDRVGFEIVAIGSDERAVMAHLEYDGPRVGKYGVDVEAIDHLAGELESAIGTADCLVIDEIAPMQLESERFREATERALDEPVPVFAAIAEGSADPLESIPVLGALSGGSSDPLESIRSRSDVELLEITEENRDELPEWLVARVQSTRE